MKPVIGIICPCRGFNSNDPYDDEYYCLNNYTQAIFECGGIPIGVMFSDKKVIKESLDLCDGFLIPGGRKVENYHFEIIDYAIKNDKPLLGICLGMQAIAIHGIKKQYGHKQILFRNINNHWPTNPTKDNLEVLVHNIKVIDKNSFVFNSIKKDIFSVNSMHNYHVAEVGNDYKITCLSDDGLIEGIEHKKARIYGVQWHPELLKKRELLTWFIEKCQKTEM